MSRTFRRADAVQNPEVNVAVGLQFVVLLHLPAQSPLKIERASVRWVKDNAFGLSFMLFLPSERAKLQKYLEDSHLTSATVFTPRS